MTRVRVELPCIRIRLSLGEIGSYRHENLYKVFFLGADSDPTNKFFGDTGKQRWPICVIFKQNKKADLRHF